MSKTETTQLPKTRANILLAVLAVVIAFVFALIATPLLASPADAALGEGLFCIQSVNTEDAAINGKGGACEPAAAPEVPVTYPATVEIVSGLAAEMDPANPTPEPYSYKVVDRSIGSVIAEGESLTGPTSGWIKQTITVNLPKPLSNREELRSYLISWTTSVTYKGVTYTLHSDSSDYILLPGVNGATYAYVSDGVNTSGMILEQKPTGIRLRF